jgi:RHS repeat-associated protein
MDASNTVIERTIGLVGGVLVTKRGGLLGVGDVWSYPNVHGDVMAIADQAGLKQGTTRTYDPFGQGAPPDNSAGNYDYGWLGSAQRPTEHAGMLNTIEMGARQYVPSLGRFLGVDPVLGGSCNDYDYVCGDPRNGADLLGRMICGSISSCARKLGGEGSSSLNSDNASLIEDIHDAGEVFSTVATVVTVGFLIAAPLGCGTPCLEMAGIASDLSTGAGGVSAAMSCRQDLVSGQCLEEAFAVGLSQGVPYVINKFIIHEAIAPSVSVAIDAFRRVF